ncbi:MAG: hypothetical protein LHW56_07480 [Candidatus Cloacimonetes bacterium]|jgi:hypothetical protein|nr:hypothetical protein [Candidatus Cloacimonadota bacterium]MCK9185755.1 hypothetical protein [Candidatus Cloacimonadota bacterium]MCK9583540.1 hypothetical protein [Candidatus Cloacimonadota bacterium]MDY0172735.1 hypothetical protein [Candidatus Cloacimonadaceae bacterium]
MLLAELIRDKTPVTELNRPRLTRFIDQDITFLDPMITDKKEEVGLKDRHIIKSGSDFPALAEQGQIFIRNGTPYIKREEG